MKTSALAVVFLASASFAGAQTTYINDNFTGATTAGTSGTTSTVSNAPGSWSTLVSGTNPTSGYYTITGDKQLGLASTTDFGSTLAYRGFTPTFTLASLATGQSLSFSFDLNIGSLTTSVNASTGAATASVFSFGLLAGNTAASDSVLYGQFEAGTAGSVFVSLKTRTGNAADAFMANGGGSVYLSSSSTPVTRTNLTGTATYTLSVTKLASGNFDLAILRNGSALHSLTNQTISTSGTSISGVAFRNFGNSTNGAFISTDYRLDNVLLGVIPEPSSVALLAGLGALGAVAYRRRRN